MGYIDNTSCTVHVGSRGTSSPIIYLVDSPEHPFDVSSLAHGRSYTLVTIPVSTWGDALTPWSAAGLYREEPDFGGHAATTLSELLEKTIPSLEETWGLSPSARAICGYSLGGLFSLYAFTHCDAFVACGCLSGSVWYEGWVDYLRERELDVAGRFAFLSVGTKEKRGGNPLMRTVQRCMEACTGILREHGCEVQYVTGPGNHLQFISERFDAGLSALDDFLARAQAHASQDAHQSS